MRMRPARSEHCRRHHSLFRAGKWRQDHVLRNHRRLHQRCGMNYEPSTPVTAEPAVAAHHFVQGILVSGVEARHRSRDLGVDFTTPAIDLDKLVLPRTMTPPLLDVSVAEIIDFLEEAGRRLALDHNPYLQEALDLVAA